MAEDTIRLNFGPPKFAVRCLPVPRKPGDVVFQIPVGAQLLRVEAPDHDKDQVHFWWAIPDEDRPQVSAKFLIVEEGQPFPVEECVGTMELDDGTVIEEVHSHLQSVGFWTERVLKGDGTLLFKSFHVLDLEGGSFHDATP